MFFDGVELTGDAITLSSGPTQSELRIGNSTSIAAQSFDGLVDELRIGPVRSADWYQVTFESANPAAPTAFVTVFPEECFREQDGACAPK